MATAVSPHRLALLVLALWAVLFLITALIRERRPTTRIPTPSDSVMAWEHFALDLEHRHDGGMGGTIAVGRNADGLVIRGVLHGASPQWTAAEHELDWDDHVEVWLADGPPTRLPAIGWGNQFEDLTMRSEDDLPTDDQFTREHIARRLDWYRRQLPFRDQVRRLFQRRWRMVPGRSEEYHARAAFADLTRDDQKHLAALAIRGEPVMSAGVATDATATFEILIPWEAFPPIQTLSVQDLRLMVTMVDNRKGGQSDIHRLSSSRQTDKELLPVRLSSPRDYTLTPFRFAMTDAMLAADIPYQPSEEAVRYIRPGRDSELASVIVLDNTSKGYQYEPDPGSRSPIAQEATFWVKPIAGHGFLAGPRLSWMHDGLITHSDAIVGDPQQLDLRVEPDGNLLLKHGPLIWWSRFGSGQCGACPRIGLDLYLLHIRDHTISNMMTYYDVVGDDGDITVSSDWRTISGYTSRWDLERNGFVWYRTDHIRSATGLTFEKGERQPVPGPPTPRTLEPMTRY